MLRSIKYYRYLLVQQIAKFQGQFFVVAKIGKKQKLSDGRAAQPY